jgi:hypothetical protein
VDYNNQKFGDEDYKDDDHKPYKPYNNHDDDDDDDNYNDEEDNVDEMDPNEVNNILQDPTQNAGVHEQPQDTPAQEEETVFEAEEPPTKKETEDTSIKIQDQIRSPLQTKSMYELVPRATAF